MTWKFELIRGSLVNKHQIATAYWPRNNSSLNFVIAREQRDRSNLELNNQPDKDVSTMNKQYYIYILTNQRHTTLYTGVTSDLIRRIYEHKNKLIDGFTKRYNLTELVYFETFETAYDAINREKQIKAGSRAKKIKLIEDMNPEWNDLYSDLH